MCHFWKFSIIRYTRLEQKVNGQSVNDNDNRKLYNKPLIDFSALTALHGDVSCFRVWKHIETSLVNNVLWWDCSCGPHLIIPASLSAESSPIGSRRGCHWDTAGLEESKHPYCELLMQGIGENGERGPAAMGEAGSANKQGRLRRGTRPSWEAQPQPVSWFDLTSWANTATPRPSSDLQTCQLMSGHCGKLLGLWEPVRQQRM